MNIEKTVILLTTRFPYYPGEEFLEEEVVYWNKYFKGKIILAPSKSSSVKRDVPSTIEVRSLNKKIKKTTKLLIATETLFSSLFFQELLYLFSIRKKMTYGLLKHVFFACYRVFFYVFRYQKMFKTELRNGALMYTYWNSTESYAMAYLKRLKNNRITLISRAHRFDVYEEYQPFNYMPLKRQFKERFDKVLAISEEGKSYLCNQYQLENIAVARLGVNVDGAVCNPDDKNKLTILSLSYCSPVKRIDRIINGIRVYALMNSNIQVSWHHIGDGTEFENLKKLADELLNIQNVNWVFHGHKTNAEVHTFLRANRIDALVNTSESEGVPVSIMEVMSYQIPAIAPDVGGIKELVLPGNGILMSSSPSDNELVAALERREFYKNPAVRQAAQEHIRCHYNAQKNFSSFINMVSNF